MKNIGNSTRARFVASALAMLLCVAMLVGTTFAWFSDEAKTGDTTITAGNLDVGLFHATNIDANTGAATPGEEFAEDEQLFTIPADFLWEPGAMWTSAPFVVKNNGSLALQYALEIAVQSETTPNLLDRVKWKVVRPSAESTAIADDSQNARRDYWSSLGEGTGAGSSGILEPGLNSTALQVVLYWEPADSVLVDDPEANPDNTYNLPKDEYDLGAPKATFSLSVFATQTPSESDSFGNQYDNIKIASSDDELHDALTEAKPGDTVSVLPGTYSADDFEDMQPDVHVQGSVDEKGNLTSVLDVADKSVKSSGGSISDFKIEKIPPVDVTLPVAALVELSDGAVIEHCEFVDIREGASSNLKAVKVDGSATIRDCKFSSVNGIYNTGEGITGELLVEKCSFDNKYGYPVNITGGSVEGHVTLRGCEFLGNGGTITIGNTQNYMKMPYFESANPYAFLWDVRGGDRKLMPITDLIVGGGVTMENCKVVDTNFEVYTDMKMSNNTFSGGTNFLIYNYYLTIASEGDDFTGCKLIDPGYTGRYHLFEGSGRKTIGGEGPRIPVMDKTYLTINGGEPNPDWVDYTT